MTTVRKPRRVLSVSPYFEARARRKDEQRRRHAQRLAAFARAQRLSPAEASYLDPNFDPGPEYDPA